MTNIELRLKAILRSDHHGRENPATAAALASELDIPERHIRKVVSEMRAKRIPICSGPEGFWYPTSWEDAGVTIGWIVGRFQSIRRSYEGFLGGMNDEFGGPTLFDQNPSEPRDAL